MKYFTLVTYTVIVTHFIEKVFSLLMGKKARLREALMVGLFAIYERSNDRTDYVLLDVVPDENVIKDLGDLYDFLSAAPHCENGAIFSRLHCSPLDMYPLKYCSIGSSRGREFIDRTTACVVHRLIRNLAGGKNEK